MNTRKLFRSETDKMIAGVCGGLGEYLGIDSTIVRLIFVFLFLLGGHGLLVYLILWIVMPPAPSAARPPAYPTTPTYSEPTRPAPEDVRPPEPPESASEL